MTAYLETLENLLLKMCLCLGRPEAEKTERAISATAKMFMEVLYGVIPEDRLEDVYIEAMRAHKNNFSLSTVDFISAWDSIRAYETSSRDHKTPCIYCENAKTTGKDCVFHK